MITYDEAKNYAVGIVQDVLIDQAKIILQDVQREYAGLSSSLGSASISIDDVLINWTASQIAFNLFARGQGALIAEYGKGSLMDKDNPAYGDYHSSDNWNSWRVDDAIYTRPKGQVYYDLDGKAYVGRSSKPINVEGKGNMVALEPRHIVKKEIEQRMPSIIEAIQRELIGHLPYAWLIDGLTITI